MAAKINLKLRHCHSMYLLAHLFYFDATGQKKPDNITTVVVIILEQRHTCDIFGRVTCRPCTGFKLVNF